MNAQYIIQPTPKLTSPEAQAYLPENHLPRAPDPLNLLPSSFSSLPGHRNDIQPILELRQPRVPPTCALGAPATWHAAS